MKIPGYIRGLANKGNKVAQAFIQQYDNGDNAPYDKAAYEAMKAQFSDGTMDLEPDYENIVGEEPMTPEEAKASEVIEGYGDKYRQDKITEQSVGDAELEEQSKAHDDDLAWWDIDSPDQTEKDLKKFEAEEFNYDSLNDSERELFDEMSTFADDYAWEKDTSLEEVKSTLKNKFKNAPESFVNALADDVYPGIESYYDEFDDEEYDEEYDEEDDFDLDDDPNWDGILTAEDIMNRSDLTEEEAQELADYYSEAGEDIGFRTKNDFFKKHDLMEDYYDIKHCVDRI